MSDDLSRLLDGDLPPDEAAALRARIAADPALAARWRAMQALPGALAALPRELAVPPHLGGSAAAPGRDAPTVRVGPARDGAPGRDAPTVGVGPARDGAPGRDVPTVRVAQDPALREATPTVAPSPLPLAAPRSPLARALPWAGWLAAAALLVSLLRPAPARVLLAGTELVEGRVDVLAGDVIVEVDGKVSISVEPPGGALRGTGAEVTPMDRKSIAGALAGSVVTVTVLQGVAWLKPADAAPVEVREGETRRVGEPAADAASERIVHATAAPEATPEERVATLERELDRAKLERAMAVGQLRRYEGVAQAWPADVPAAWKPDAFEGFLRQRVAAIPDAEIVALDCEEYPCIALIRSHSEAQDWQDRLMPMHDGLEAAGFGEDLHVVGMGRHMQTDAADVRLYGFAVTPAGEDDTVRQRVRFRTDAALEDAAQQMIEPGE